MIQFVLKQESPPANFVVAIILKVVGSIAMREKYIEQIFEKTKNKSEAQINEICDNIETEILDKVIDHPQGSVAPSQDLQSLDPKGCCKV